MCLNHVIIYTLLIIEYYDFKNFYFIIFICTIRSSVVHLHECLHRCQGDQRGLTPATWQIAASPHRCRCLAWCVSACLLPLVQSGCGRAAHTTKPNDRAERRWRRAALFGYETWSSRQWEIAFLPRKRYWNAAFVRWAASVPRAVGRMQMLATVSTARHSSSL